MFEVGAVHWYFMSNEDACRYRAGGMVTAESLRNVLATDRLSFTDELLPYAPVTPDADSWSAPLRAMRSDVLYKWHKLGRGVSTPGDVLDTGRWLVWGLVRFSRTTPPYLAWELARRMLLADAGDGEEIRTKVVRNMAKDLSDPLSKLGLPKAEIFHIAVNWTDGVVAIECPEARHGDVLGHVLRVLDRLHPEGKRRESLDKWAPGRVAPSLLSPITALQREVANRRALVILHPNTHAPWFAALLEPGARAVFDTAHGQVIAKDGVPAHLALHPLETADALGAVVATEVSLDLFDGVNERTLSLGLDAEAKVIKTKLKFSDGEVGPKDKSDHPMDQAAADALLALDAAVWVRRVLEGLWRALEMQQPILALAPPALMDSFVGLPRLVGPREYREMEFKKRSDGQLSLFGTTVLGPEEDQEEGPEEDPDKVEYRPGALKGRQTKVNEDGSITVDVTDLLGGADGRRISLTMPPEASQTAGSAAAAPASAPEAEPKAWLPSEEEIADIEAQAKAAGAHKVAPVEESATIVALPPPRPSVSAEEEIEILKRRVRATPVGQRCDTETYRRLHGLTAKVGGADGVRRMWAWMNVQGVLAPFGEDASLPDEQAIPEAEAKTEAKPTKSRKTRSRGA